jgi:L-ascorbate metabolism protein UlaG (beta-lactamase superfamily)
VGLLAFTSVGGCTLNPFHLAAPGDCPRAPANTGDAAVRVDFLGVDGFLVSRGPDAFLTGPLLSNPALLEVGVQEIRSDRLMIDALLRGGPDLSGVSAIFVGHSHYDHLMDVPYLADRHATRATIYGSTTTKNILNGYSPALASRVVALDDAQSPAYYSWYQPGPGPVPWQGVQDALGQPVPMRFLALESEHSPILDLHQALKMFPVKGETWIPWHGTVDRKLTELPRTAAGWPSGRVFAYLIDFLDASGKPAFRVYFQDSAARKPLGSVPALGDGKRVDLAILCVGGARYVSGNPEEIMRNTQARYFILGHWDDFVVPRPTPLPRGSQLGSIDYREMPTVDTQGFVDRVKRELGSWRKAGTPTSGFCVPCPGSTLYFTASGDRLGSPSDHCQAIATPAKGP